MRCAPANRRSTSMPIRIAPAALIGEVQILARRGFRRLDQRASWRWIARPVCGRRLARTATSLNKDRLATAIVNVLSQNAFGEIVPRRHGTPYRKTEIDVQTAEPDIPPRSASPRQSSFPPLVAPDRPGASDRLLLWIGKPRHFDGGRNRGRKTQSDRGGPAATRKANKRTDNGSVDALAKAIQGPALGCG